MIELNTIYNEDNIETMKKIPSNYIDGIICSPPYNFTTKRSDMYYDNGYSHIDNLSEEEYIKIRIAEFKEFGRIVKDKGVILYNISYGHNNPILPLLLITEVHKQTDLTLADMISWKKSNSIPFQTSPNKLSRLVEQVYVIVKKKHLQDFKANKEVSSVNQKTGQKFYKNYVNFIEAKNNDGIKSKLKASYSEELVDKLINIYFDEESIIYDPFMGTGTSARSCIKNRLYFIGSELDKEHYDVSIDTIKKIN